MAHVCDRCGRGPQVINNRSHSNIATKRRQMVNLQSKRIDGIRSWVCTKCISTLNKAK